MNTKQKLKKTALVKAVRRDDPYLTLGAARVESDKFWRWGDDNLFPAALALMSRRSTTHRRIINDKADYISGKVCTLLCGLPKDVVSPWAKLLETVAIMATLYYVFQSAKRHAAALQQASQNG